MHFRVGRDGWAGGEEEVFDFELGALVGDSLVVDDEVIGDFELIMSVAAQQRRLHLLLCHLNDNDGCLGDFRIP